MKIRFDEKGFTLVELVVVINLSFMIIAAVVSLYLLTNKYFLGTTRRFEEKEITLDFLYKLEEFLSKTDNYTFVASSDSLQILSIRDTINFQKDKITSHILPAITDLDSMETRLSFLSGNEIILSGEKTKEWIKPGETVIYSSDSITAVSLLIKRGKVYRTTIYNKPTPYKLFRNL
ncbi:MAG: hypothetical protein FD122_2703 [Stygiobacter sp.]|nr:MAG: hypothetical protein FD122_2703 [Stygiobacter sp.]KAF0214124.1 MAG: hypothetical protein FD178_2710 [Ignavibacteria bacterium]